MLATGATPAARPHTPVPNARKEIEAAYRQLAQALQRKDLPGAMRFYLPDYTRFDASGTRFHRAQFKQALTRVLRSQRAVQEMRFRILTFRAHHTTATVTARAYLRAQVVAMDGRERPVAGQTYAMAATWPFREFWVRTPQGWRIRTTRLLAPTRASMELLP
ncbi:MAG: nuclear transport factor 2 family protein [Chloroherpetonaceae bacterium]|nr:nuclear transport factor 2 family protein [Chthonomonadaceae bacterium]MDW8207093.1 nuclear transport factor 2 family protein [Chloroherpetonaceae bacterium]